MGYKRIFKVKEDSSAATNSSSNPQWWQRSILKLRGYISMKFIPLSIRLFLAIVTQMDLEVEQLDVKITFLYGNLEETIFMESPEGY